MIGQLVRGEEKMDKHQALRYLKYAVVAPAIGLVVRRTSLLDGSRHEPPRAINFAGGGDFRQIGDNQVAILVARAGLSEHDRVLDIGCGIGRIAMALHRRFPHLEERLINAFGFAEVAVRAVV